MDALLQQALTAHRAGRLDEASRLYDAVLALDKRNALALAMLGTIHAQRRNYEEALRLIGLSLKRDPRQPHALNSKGIALRELKRPGEALASFDAAIALDPSFADAHCNRANALRQLKRLPEAIAGYQRALALRPDLADAYYNCGLALQDLKRPQEALAHFNRAVALSPNTANFYLGLGNALFDLKRHAEAVSSYRKTVALDAHHPYALGTYVHAKSVACDWDGWREASRALIAGIEQGTMAAEPFVAITLIGNTALQRRCTDRFVKDGYAAVHAPLWRGQRYTHDKIKIAYLSADFRAHAVSYQIAGVLEEHDRGGFEIFGISFSEDDGDPIRGRLASACDHFIDVRMMSDVTIARLLREREIDIAVDLQGFTKDARTNIFAHRPAPVQVAYLGFPGTMGLPSFDYILADRVVIPPQERAHYTEKVVYLPDCYLCNDAKRRISEYVPSRKEAGLPETGFVFSSFNAARKLTPDIFDIWMRLLTRIPDSVLWLADPKEPARSNLRREAETRNVSAARLIFADFRLSVEDHLARLKLADLFMDTLPHNAHATASDALWAGLPVLSCPGNSFAGRVAASILTAIGLPELIAPSLAEYEEMALKLSRDAELLAGIKAKLAAHRDTFALFDTARFTRNLESAYRTMWNRAQAGLPPEHLALGNPAR